MYIYCLTLQWKGRWDCNNFTILIAYSIESQPLHLYIHKLIDNMIYTS